MNPRTKLLFLSFLSFAPFASAEVKVTSERIDAGEARASFKFPTVPVPRREDAAAKAVFTLVDGGRDANGGDLSVLHDGKLPRGEDEPAANFFFNSKGGRLLVDLGSVIEVRQVNTYSWHAAERGPQIYRLYASDGKGEGFVAQPKRPVDPAQSGWKLVATVDSRQKDKELGGQYGISIADPAAPLGSFRYLLFDIDQSDAAHPWGNTFFSEIDIVNRLDPEPAAADEVKEIVKAFDIPGGMRFTVETTDAPDLTEWAEKELVPVVQQWYPKLVEMLPSEGFAAPRTFSISFTNSYKGVAATAGNRVMCDPAWFRRELKREALGAVVHELVHVVQQYGRARRAGGAPPPGWLVEGLCDYIRWYLYEPQSRGAEIRPEAAARARYDAAYRPTANFLNFVLNHYDQDLIKKLNAAMREGKFTAEMWKTLTGKTAEELSEEWKKALAEAK